MLELICLSHTPLLDTEDPGPGVREEVEAKFAELRQAVEAFSPQVIVVFAPDHFNGFFYDVMPPFCIGVRAEGAGDYGLPTGSVRVDSDLAMACQAAAAAAGVDVAVSYRMRLDHGFVQPLQVLLAEREWPPIVPVFVNCAAPPLASFARCRTLGEALGKALSECGKRVLLVGSGGLSHDPPIPSIDTASDAAAAFMIDGRHALTEADRRVREDRVRAAAREFARGDGDLRPLNPAWDLAFLERLKAADWLGLDSYVSAAVRADAGRGGQEVRTWVAAAAALGASGGYEALGEYYRPVPGWIAGMAMLHARPTPKKPLRRR